VSAPTLARPDLRFERRLGLDAGACVAKLDGKLEGLRRLLTRDIARQSSVASHRHDMIEGLNRTRREATKSTNVKRNEI